MTASNEYLSGKLPLHLKSLKKITKGTKIKVLSGGGTIVVAKASQKSKLKTELKSHVSPYQLRKLQDLPTGPLLMEGTKGVIGVVILPEENAGDLHHEGLLDPSNYGLSRDYVGKLYLDMEEYGLEKLNLVAFHCDYDEILGSLLGIEMGAYNFKKSTTPLTLSAQSIGDFPTEGLTEVLKSAAAIGGGVNMARFLVDVPPGDKRPHDYSDYVTDLFKTKKTMTVTVWNETRLKKEKMGCILGVGAGSAQSPRLVHLKYRPTKAKDIPPVAFVGKGITFDTGGVNLKPAGGMRMMKKDMGGSACLVGFAQWLVDSQCDVPCDIYLALAENSVDAHSFRPSDVLTARNGMTVEIDNTDAEGRLVMADALSLATEKKGKEAPQFVIDVSTLTGAIKVGLGDDIGGLFSNNDDLAFVLQSCSQISGDLLWRMPLMKSQRGKLNSDVADIANSSSGFGGAIRAAMFLQEFTNEVPWAHLDIYAWNAAKINSYRSSGGSGQGVQCLAQFISQL
ncbi:MAG: leucyl aminopeptidase family protein [Halobacteriovoraceae bacterium]|nr:leucyl aminopeptidase family protein [Halobacteriovoraceae bacterium]